MRTVTRWVLILRKEVADGASGSGKTKRSLSGSSVCTDKVSKLQSCVYIVLHVQKPQPIVQSGNALLSRGQEMELQSLGSDFVHKWRYRRVSNVIYGNG